MVQQQTRINPRERGKGDRWLSGERNGGGDITMIFARVYNGDRNGMVQRLKSYRARAIPATVNSRSGKRVINREGRLRLGMGFVGRKVI